MLCGDKEVKTWKGESEFIKTYVKIHWVCKDRNSMHVQNIIVNHEKKERDQDFNVLRRSSFMSIHMISMYLEGLPLCQYDEHRDRVT